MIEMLILLSIWLIACAVCFAIGFFVACKYKDINKTKKSAEPITEQQIKEAEKIARELDNFYRYDGTKQDDFNA